MRTRQRVAIWTFIVYFLILVLLTFGPLRDFQIGYNNVSQRLGLIDSISLAPPGTTSVYDRIEYGYSYEINYIAFLSYALVGLLISAAVFFTSRKTQ